MLDEIQERIEELVRMLIELDQQNASYKDKQRIKSLISINEKVFDALGGNAKKRITYYH